MKLNINIAGIEWKNPVTTASGTVNSGKEYSPYVDFSKLGALTTKSVSAKPWKGSQTPRIAETYGGMVHSIGLQNPGIDEFIQRDIPYFKKLDTAIIVNICAREENDFVEVARRLEEASGIHMLELNLACKSDDLGGFRFAQNTKWTESVLAKVKKVTNLPVIAKLTPNVTDIAEIAKAAEAGGACALSLINSVSAMRINIETRKPILASAMGGLSGPAIKPIALRCVYQAYKAVNIPIIGMGGIMTGEDAIEFLMAGATAVGVGMAHFINPRAALEVIEDIEAYMEKHGIDDVVELTGAAH
ncbi:MAG: dihydroorotate dehydrogenase [Defluviitaleaceae bacterium]|nr:dihydroorotate dehydrogenase [Defluviitaleaceae bacterium]